jgi:hypothetical protein
MGIAGFGRTELRYDMFDLARSAEEAKRMDRCAHIYHRGQEMAWDGREILPMLIAKHGRIDLSPDKKAALERVFSIIMWGELAAWKISAQLADGLVPLEAKMAATSQAFDEARHFYVMHDYLGELGYTPRPLDRAPQALLDLVLDTRNLAYKLLGMQLCIETIALTVFQTVRELEVEPVLSELMRYYERDEARHVGLGMQYLPSLMREMGKAETARLITFQIRLLAWALWENKVLEKDFAVLGIDPREILERGRRKQLAALHAAFDALGIDLQKEDRNPAGAMLNAAVELAFPTAETRGRPIAMARAAWRAFQRRDPRHAVSEFDVHASQTIKTARGWVGPADTAEAAE